MAIILDHVSSISVLEINDWPRLAPCKEWFAVSSQLSQQTFADMDLDPATEAELMEDFTSAWFL